MTAQPRLASPAIRVRQDSACATYLVDLSPAELPAVPGRELDAAWEAARGAAAQAGPPRAFRFRRADGSTIDLALAGAEARRWADAVDRRGGARGGLHTVLGLALCVRLLALADLLARAVWARAWRRGRDLDPRLLRAAAALPLTEEAGFDEARCLARLMQGMVAPRQDEEPAP